MELRNTPVDIVHLTFLLFLLMDLASHSSALPLEQWAQSALEQEVNSPPVQRQRRAPKPLSPALPRASCKTIERWTTLTEAKDVFGKPVKVLSKFSQDTTLIEQNFFERYCASDERIPSTSRAAASPISHISQLDQCEAIDSSKFRGFCKTRTTYTYAKVENSRGVVGWTRIAIRGGCECAVFAREDKDEEIMQYLRH